MNRSTHSLHTHITGLFLALAASAWADPAVDEVLRQVLKGEISGQMGFELLKEKIDAGSGTEVRTKLVPFLPRVASREEAFYWMQSALKLCLPVNDSPDVRRAVLTEHREDWLALIDQITRADARIHQEPSHEKNEIWTALDLILRLDPSRPGPEEKDVFGFPQTGFRKLHHLNPQLVLKLARERAIALVEGKSPAPLPSAQTVPPARRAALFEEFRALPVGEVIAKFRALPLQEAAALDEHLKTMPAWPESLREAASRISRIEVDGVRNTGTWKALEGKQVNVPLLQALVQQINREGTDRGIYLSLSNYGTLAGWMVLVEGEPDPTQRVLVLYPWLEFTEVKAGIPLESLCTLHANFMSAEDYFGNFINGKQAFDPSFPEEEDVWKILGFMEKSSAGKGWFGHIAYESIPGGWLREEIAAKPSR